MSRVEWLEGLPADGQEIEFRCKGSSDWRRGRVAFVFASPGPDDPCVNVWVERDVDDFAFERFFPSLGDEWRPPPPEAPA
jgi:hypothetical protein